MNLYKKINVLKLAFAFAFISTMTFNSFAQNNPAEQQAAQQYSEEELTTFVDLANKLIPIEIEAQEQMMKEVEDAGLSVERYNEIATMEELGMDAQVEGEELQQYKKASESINKIQEDAEGVIKNTIQEEGMTMEKFQGIMEAYHENAEVKQQIDEKMAM